jgi:hypothetical protein
MLIICVVEDCIQGALKSSACQLPKLYSRQHFKMGKGGPELASYMEKTLSLKMDAGRHIEGVLRGYDPFLNIVLDQVPHCFPPLSQHVLTLPFRHMKSLARSARRWD